jgi:endonuclease G, mitochondrial
MTHVRLRKMAPTLSRHETRELAVRSAVVVFEAQAPRLIGLRSGSLSWILLAALLATAMLQPRVAIANVVEVQHSAKLYAEPNTTSAVLERFDPDEAEAAIMLTVVSDERTNGYFEVITPAGHRGWIYKTRVRHHPGTTGEESTATGPVSPAIPDAASPASGAATAIPGGIPVESGVGDRVTHIQNAAYSVAYSESRWNPLWAFHRVGVNHSGSCPRLTKFLVDARTESGVTHNDYDNSGYDRGHMVPSSTIGSEFGCAAQDETYFMSNIAPQLPRLNQKAWLGFEEMVEAVYAKKFGGVWVLAGPIFDPSFVRELCSGVEVPVAFYKIVLRSTPSGLDAIAVIMPQDTPPGVPLRQVTRSIDEVEQRTGIDFFAGLPDPQERTLESTLAQSADWELDTTLNSSFPGTPRKTCLKPPVARNLIAVDQ